MKASKIDLLASYSRARRVAWAKLNGGDAGAKLSPGDWRHNRHAAIMGKLRDGVLRCIRRKASRPGN